LASVVLRLIVLVSALGLCGCGTLLSSKSSPYSGVQMDAALAGHSFPHPGAILPVMDLPASFVADTVLLPVTLSSSSDNKSDSFGTSISASGTTQTPHSFRTD
jgi:uncharacterized protein YceK